MTLNGFTDGQRETNVCENVMRDGSEKFDATGFCSGFSEETGAIQFQDRH